MAGRPTKCTPELTTELCELIAEGVPIALACEMVGIDNSTYTRWNQKGDGPEAGEPYCTFRTEAMRANKEAIRYHIGIVKAAARTDAANSRWWLARTKSAHFKEKTEQQVTIDTDHAMDNLTDEELDRRQREILDGLKRT